jgi:hypothetical protein
MATSQFASLDSKTIASVDKISLSAPGSNSAWMHRLGQYLRMMPLRFAASSTILLAIIVLICIFAFRLARYKVRLFIIYCKRRGVQTKPPMRLAHSLGEKKFLVCNGTNQKENCVVHNNRYVVKMLMRRVWRNWPNTEYLELCT